MIYAVLFSIMSYAVNFSARPILLALISTIVIFCGCSTEVKAETPETVRVITSDKMQNRNGISYEVNQTTPFTGLLQDFYSNGQKDTEGSYKDGKEDGIYTRWYKNGQKKLEINFKNGKFQGVTTAWHKNGQKKSEGNFKDGKLHGVATTWDENGQMRQEVNVKDGKLHGVATTWDENGKEVDKTLFENGLEKK